MGDPGVFTYTFTNTLTAPVDPNRTTVVGLYVYKDAGASVGNDVFAFEPAGGEPKTARDVVSTAACQTCHNPLEAHGGLRRETGVCVTCHTPQARRPVNREQPGFQGDGAPAALGGGAAERRVRQAVPDRRLPADGGDYSHGTWPQDVRNGTTCHVGGAQSENYALAPNAAACTSCHDDVNLATGENHPGGPQADGVCAACHPASGPEVGPSISGAHTIPAKSTQVKGVKLEIVKVEGAVPGGNLSVTLKVTDNAGAAVQPADMDYLALTLAGPTSDYAQRVTETVFRKPSDKPPAVTEAGDGAYTYTFEAKIPDDAKGSYAVGMEGYVMETIVGVPDAVRVAGYNPVTYVALDGGKATPRQMFVDREALAMPATATWRCTAALARTLSTASYAITQRRPMRPAGLLKQCPRRASTSERWSIASTSSPWRPGHWSFTASATRPSVSEAWSFRVTLPIAKRAMYPTAQGCHFLRGSQPTTVTQAGRSCVADAAGARRVHELPRQGRGGRARRAADDGG